MSQGVRGRALAGALSLVSVAALTGCARGGGPALPVPGPIARHGRGAVEVCATGLDLARAEAARAGTRVSLVGARRLSYRSAVRLVDAAGGSLPPPPPKAPRSRRSATPGRSAAPGVPVAPGRTPTPPRAASPRASTSAGPGARRPASPSPSSGTTGVPAAVCLFSFSGDFRAGRGYAVVTTARHPRVVATSVTRRPVPR